jgi:hypothetical protein
MRRLRSNASWFAYLCESNPAVAMCPIRRDDEERSRSCVSTGISVMMQWPRDKPWTTSIHSDSRIRDLL